MQMRWWKRLRQKSEGGGEDGQTKPPKVTDPKRGRKVSYALAAVSLIVSVIWAFLSPPATNDIQKLATNFLVITTGLVVGAAILIMGFTYDIHRRLDEFSSILDKEIKQLGSTLDTKVQHFDQGLSQTVAHFDGALKDAITRFERVVDCVYLGPGSQTLSQVLDRLENAQSVRNTFVLFGIEEKDAYAEGKYEEIHKKISAFLEKGGSWTDIVSQDVVNSPNIYWLRFLRDLYTAAEQSGAQSKAAIERYRMYHLKGIYPLINFIILKYQDDSEEVIFGWGHHSEDPNGRVFLSRNKHLITTFDLYWDILEKDSSLVKQSDRPITPAKITGLWFRVSYLVSPEWKARDGIPPAAIEDDPYDLALVTIDIKESRNLFVEGMRFEVDKNADAVEGDESTIQIRRRPEQSGFESKVVDLEGKRIWFSTTSASDEKLHIAGWYRFVIDERNKKPGDTRIQRFRGEFVEYVPTDGLPLSKYAVGKLVLFGRKVPKGWLEKNLEDLDFTSKTEEFLSAIPHADEDRLKLIAAGLSWWRDGGKKKWLFGRVRDQGSTGKL